MLAGVEPGDDGIDDAGGAVDDVERRVEPVLGGLALGDVDGVLVAHPAGVDAVHVDAVGVVLRGAGARHHVERGLRHVRVRVLRRLEPPVELPFDGRHVHHVLVALGRPEHERLESCVQHERRDRVDQLGLEELDGRYLGEHQPPRVPVAQVDLLQVLVETALGEQVVLRMRLARQQRALRERWPRR